MKRFFASHLSALASHPGRFTVLIVALVMQLAYQLGSPLSYKLIFDEGIGQGRNDIMTFALIGLALLLALQSAGTILQEFSIARLAAQRMNDLRGQLFAKLQTMSPLALAARPESEMAGLFGRDVAAVETALVRALPSTLLQVMVILFSLVLLLVISWQLFLVTMAALPLVYFLPKGFAGRAKIWQEKQSGDASKLAALAQESISASLIVRLFNLSETRRQMFDTRLGALEKSTVPAYRMAGLVGHTAFIGTGLSQLVVIGTGSLLAVSGHITAGYLVAYVGLLLRISDAVGALSSAIPLLIPAFAAQERLQALLDETVVPLQAADARPVESLSGDITFEHVDFSYSADQPILSDISFTVRPGERIALIGPSGCGKSTILSLLMRLNRPQSGRILLDGIPLEGIIEDSLRSHMVVVPQVPILFDATITENIMAGRPDLTQEDVVRAAQAAGVHDSIMRKPLGYDTPVRVTGGELSGGERQRIACARAFARGARILLLDEATSALDPVSEEVVNQSLGAMTGHSTILSVTHRLNGIVDYDRILAFDRGRLVEQGRHEQLLAQKGLYAQLWGKQSGFSLDVDDGSPSVTPERLAQIPFLAGCSAEALQEFSRLFFPVRIEQGRDVFAQGDNGDNFYIIARGRFAVKIDDDDGGQQVVATLTEGDFFGELALVRNQRRAATVSAVTEGWCLGLARPHFNAVMEAEPEFRRRVIEQVAAITGIEA